MNSTTGPQIAVVIPTLASADVERDIRMDFGIAVSLVFDGGLINSTKDAVACAKIIAGQDPRLAAIPESALRPAERSAIWHISVAHPKSGRLADLMTFSRRNGKVLSTKP